MRTIKTFTFLILTAAIIYSCKKTNLETEKSASDAFSELSTKLAHSQDFLHYVSKRNAEREQIVSIYRSHKSKNSKASLSTAFQQNNFLQEVIQHRLNVIREFPEISKLTREQKKIVFLEALRTFKPKQSLKNKGAVVMDSASLAACLDNCEVTSWDEHDANEAELFTALAECDYQANNAYYFCQQRPPWEVQGCNDDVFDAWVNCDHAARDAHYNRSYDIISEKADCEAWCHANN